jgi:hypothetical protein
MGAKWLQQLWASYTQVPHCTREEEPSLLVMDQTSWPYLDHVLIFEQSLGKRNGYQPMRAYLSGEIIFH